MKNKLASFAIICFFFYGNSVFKAQESKEILDLKKKLSSVKTDDKKVVGNKKFFSTYYPTKNIDSSSVYAKNTIPLLEKKKDGNVQGEMHVVVAELYYTKADFNAAELHQKKGEYYLENSTGYNSKEC